MESSSALVSFSTEAMTSFDIIQSAHDLELASSNMKSEDFVNVDYTTDDLENMPSADIQSSNQYLESECASNQLVLPSDVETPPGVLFQCSDLVMPTGLDEEDLNDLIMSSEDISSFDPVFSTGSLGSCSEDLVSHDIAFLPNVDLHLECADDSQYEMPKKHDVGNHTVIGQNVQLRITFPESKLGDNKHEMLPVRFSCPHCKRTFGKEQLLKQHLVSGHGQVLSFNCSKCDFKTQSNRNLLRHIRRRHKRRDLCSPSEETSHFSRKRAAGMTPEVPMIVSNTVECSSFSQMSDNNTDSANISAAECHDVRNIVSLKMYQNLHSQSANSTLANGTVSRSHRSVLSLCPNIALLDPPNGYVANSLDVTNSCNTSCTEISPPSSSQLPVLKSTGPESFVGETGNQMSKKDKCCSEQASGNSSLPDKTKSNPFKLTPCTTLASPNANSHVIVKSLTVSRRPASSFKGKPGSTCLSTTTNGELSVAEDLETRKRNVHQQFPCSWRGCRKSFRDKHNLETHYAIHSGSKPRQCKFCLYCCVQKSSMNWHMKTKHPSEAQGSHVDSNSTSSSVSKNFPKTIHVELIKIQ